MVAFLSGCSGGHGQHTSQALTEAQERLGALKAGSEYEMAQQQFLAGDLEKALRTADKSIAMSGSVAKSHVLRGRILIEQGRLEAAKDSLDKALAIDPVNAQGLYFSGVVFERFSQYDKAYERYLAAADADSSDPQYPIAAAEMLVEQRRYDEAERLLEDRGGSFEHNAGIRQTLGHIASFKGEPDKAVRFYAEACVLAPEDMGALEDLARAQMDAGQLDDAEHNLSRVIQSMKGEPRRDLRHLEAKCLEGMGRHGEARSIYLGLTGGKDGSSDVVAWIGAGRTACALSDFARVRIAANRIIALAPARAEGRLLLAACKRQDGDLEGALALADEAAALAPNDPASWVFKGVVFRQMGRLDEAAQSLATAVRIDPTNARVREMLAAIEAKD